MNANILARLAISIALIIPVDAMAQCPGAVGDAAAAAPPKIAIDAPIGEQKYILVEEKGNIRPLFYVKIGKLAVYEGDIVLGDADEIERLGKLGPVSYNSSDARETLHPFGLAARSVLSGRRRWSGGVVPYEIEDGLAQRLTVVAATDTWASSTKQAVTFIERTAANAAKYPNYVRFIAGTDSNACFSDYLGMHGGKQYVRLVTGCDYGQILHEIGHVLGLDHEQNRSDRNKYVRVNFKNIISGYAAQFVQNPAAEADIGSYDADSIMHYEADAFSCNGQPTIEPIAANLPAFGQRAHLSEGDSAAVRLIYK